MGTLVQIRNATAAAQNGGTVRVRSDPRSPVTQPSALAVPKECENVCPHKDLYSQNWKWPGPCYTDGH